MLYSIDTGKYVQTLPHKKDFIRWRKQLSEEDYSRVIDTLHEKVTSQNISTAGWIPGNNWIGTVYEPIYYACGQNYTQAGMFFGLILFEYLMHYPDCVWGFGKFEKNGTEIGSITYFVLDNPPEWKD